MTNHRLNQGELTALVALAQAHLDTVHRNNPDMARQLEQAIDKLNTQLELLK